VGTIRKPLGLRSYSASEKKGWEGPLAAEGDVYHGETFVVMTTAAGEHLCQKPRTSLTDQFSPRVCINHQLGFKIDRLKVYSAERAFIDAKFPASLRFEISESAIRSFEGLLYA
jgi:hypothetical protein